MSLNEDLRTYSSVGYMMKTPSETPSTTPSRQSSKRTKSSKSSVIVQRSTTPSEAYEKFEIPKECECGPDLYSRVLGPTADETILTGLRTVIDLCSKLRACGEDEEPERDQDLPEKDVPVPMSSSKIQTERNTVSAGFQVSPSVKSTTVQTAPFPEVVSEILQTVGLTPEMISKVIQTSFVEPKKPSLASMFMQTSAPSLISNAMQTTEPELRPGSTQASLISVKSPQSEEKIPEPQSKVYTTEQTLKGDEHTAISPPEPPEKVKLCKCCKCSSTSIKRASKDSKSSEEKSCICDSKKSKCKCDGAKRQEKPTNGDQETPSEVRYAVTKISKYNEFTTYEVMKSTKNQPKQMPRTIEGVFVLKKKNGSGEGKEGHEESKSETNVMKRRHSKNTKNGVLKDSNGGANGATQIISQSKVQAY